MGVKIRTLKNSNTLIFQGGKLFGKGKEFPNIPVVEDLQAALDSECKRSKQLQEQVDRLRADNFQQANDCKYLF